MKRAAIVLAALALCGCISAKSFIDPGFPKVGYEQVQRRPVPWQLELSTQFQRNGQPFAGADPTLRSSVERVLRESGFVAPAPAGADGRMHVIVNNIADMGEAMRKGFGTGLTFGAAGSTVTDAYEMSVTITVGGKTFTRTAVRHALHTAIGNTPIPPGVEPVAPQVAFERVVEQMLLRVLREYQSVQRPADA